MKQLSKHMEKSIKAQVGVFKTLVKDLNRPYVGLSQEIPILNEIKRCTI